MATVPHESKDKEPDVLPPLPPLRKSEPTSFLPFADDRKRLDSPNPIGERVSKKFERGGFIPTPSYSDITSIRESIEQINFRLNNLEAAMMDLVKVVGKMNRENLQ